MQLVLVSPQKKSNQGLPSGMEFIARQLPQKAHERCPENCEAVKIKAYVSMPTDGCGRHSKGGHIR